MLLLSHCGNEETGTNPAEYFGILVSKDDPDVGLFFVVQE